MTERGKAREKQIHGWQRSGKGKWRVTASGCPVYFRGDDNVLKLDRGNSSVTVYTLKASEQSTLTG